MNNKGFAITSIIYGLMLLFIMAITSFLAILVGRNRKMETLVSEVRESVRYEVNWRNENEIKFNDIMEENGLKYYQTPKRDLYYFEYNISSEPYDTAGCLVYLPKDTLIIYDNFSDSDNYALKYSFTGGDNIEGYSNLSDLCIK